MSSASTSVQDSASQGATRNNVSQLVVRKDKTNPRRIAYLILFLFATPGPIGLLIFGAILVLLAVLLHAWAAGYLARAGYVERVEKVLTVGGPYRHNRNPYYLAHLNMDFGFFCMAGLPWLYLLYFPISFGVYRKWVKNEEPFLLEEFGDKYQTFKNEVPRWAFRLTPAPSFKDGPERFSWETFKINRELSRSIPHLVILAAFVIIYFAGNPFANVDEFVKYTWIGGVMSWLLLHDIYPDGSAKLPKSTIWTIATVIAAFGLLYAVSLDAMWQPWSALSVWIAVPVALILGISVTVKVASKRKPDVKPAGSTALLQWYKLGLAFGLLTLHLGGLWIGIGVVLIAWMLQMSGKVRIVRFPQHKSFAVIVTVVLLAMAVLAVSVFR